MEFKPVAFNRIALTMLLLFEFTKMIGHFLGPGKFRRRCKQHAHCASDERQQVVKLHTILFLALCYRALRINQSRLVPALVLALAAFLVRSLGVEEAVLGEQAESEIRVLVLALNLPKT